MKLHLQAGKSFKVPYFDEFLNKYFVADFINASNLVLHE